MTQANYPAGWLLEPYKAEEHLSMARATSKTKDYLNVAQRLLWFVTEQRQMIAAGVATHHFAVEVKTIEINMQAGYATCEAYVRDVLGNEARDIGTETLKDFADFPEKAATKAKGRALASLGYGTAFAPELDEGERIVDTPIERKQQTAQTQQPRMMEAPQPEKKLPDDGTSANKEQLTSLRKLYDALGREMPASNTFTFVTASDMLRKLAREYNERRRGKTAHDGHMETLHAALAANPAD